MGIYFEVSEEKLEKLAKQISKEMRIDLQEANSLIYEEFDLIESLMIEHKKLKDVVKSFIRELNSLYQIA